MKNPIKICLALALALPLAACGENKAAQTTMKDAGSAVAAGWETVKAEAVKATDEASKSLGELETKASAMTGEAKTKLDAMIKSIKAKKDEIAKLSEEKTEAAGAKLKTAIADLKKMINDATAVK